MDEEQAAALVVRHMLFRSFPYPGCPVKREELAEAVQRQHPHTRGLLGSALTRAQRLCHELLGLELAQLELPGAGPTPQRFYVLRSELAPEALRDIVPEDAAAEAALQLAVCALVKGAGGSLPEDSLWAHLARLGLRRGSTTHPQFGSVDAVFQRLLKHRYLVLRKGRAEDGPAVSSYELGPNACDGIGEQQLQRYFERVCQTTD